MNMAPDALLGIDHVVIAVADLSAAVADYRALGFTVTPGGRHPGRPTENALVVFGDGAYLELITYHAAAPQERWWLTLQADGSGFVDHALWPRDVGAALAAARARGLHTLTGPLPGSRLRPDGTRIDWVTARHATPELPFLCADLTPRALRVPEGDARVHANGARGIAELVVAVPEIDAAVARYQALLGPATAIESRPPDGEDLRRAGFRLAGQSVLLLAPGSGTADTHPLRQRLRRRGPGPCALTLAAGGGAVRALPTAASQGAALRLA